MLIVDTRKPRVENGAVVNTEEVLHEGKKVGKVERKTIGGVTEVFTIANSGEYCKGLNLEWLKERIRDN